MSRPLLAVAAAWQQAHAARFIDRPGKGVRTAPRDAIIAESTKTTHPARAFGLHRAMDTAGAVLGPASLEIAIPSPRKPVVPLMTRVIAKGQGEAAGLSLKEGDRARIV